MPVVLILPVSGRAKRDLIEMMREFCGQAGFDFELTPEEVASDLRLLDTMMAEHPFNLMGYSAASYGAGLPEDPSGLAEIDVQAVVTSLAMRRNPALGSSMSPQAVTAMAKTYQSACSRYAIVPAALLAPSTPRGSGNTRWWRSPFITETADE